MFNYSYREIRQGDPLSPYLFLLCADGLSMFLPSANAMSNLTDIPFAPMGPRISHLLFADDSLILFEVNELQCTYLPNMLLTYGKVSGQCINFSKSALLFSPNMHDDRQLFLQSLLGVQLVRDFGNYLGLPPTFSRYKGKDWSFLKDRI